MGPPRRPQSRRRHDHGPPPVVGELRLHRDKLPIDDVILVVYYPDKDSDSDEKLRLLAALSLTESASTAHDRPSDTPHPRTL
ncbi:hypothetical protein GCM10017744_013060 [Streptomyces antimycoticus]